MSDPQPIQPTSAIVHLRRAADGVCSRHGGRPEQMPEWLAADLIEWQQRRIKALTDSLVEARSALVGSRAVCESATTALGMAGADVAEILAEYDELLARIDRAMEMK